VITCKYGAACDMAPDQRGACELTADTKVVHVHAVNWNELLHCRNITTARCASHIHLEDYFPTLFFRFSVQYFCGRQPGGGGGNAEDENEDEK
jgi:hypothetical protein